MVRKSLSREGAGEPRSKCQAGLSHTNTYRQSDQGRQVHLVQLRHREKAHDNERMNLPRESQEVRTARKHIYRVLQAPMQLGFHST